jgi:hypothetical protein
MAVRLLAQVLSLGLVEILHGWLEAENARMVQSSEVSAVVGWGALRRGGVAPWRGDATSEMLGQ